MDDHAREILDREGWLAIAGVIDPSLAPALAQQCLDAADDGDPRQNDKLAGGTRRTADLLERMPDIAGVVDHPEVRAAVSHLIGAEVAVTDIALRCPQPGFGHQTLHADDLPVSRAGECRAVTAIIALCAFDPSNGSTAVIPGSHLRPDLQHRPDRHHLEPHEIRFTGSAGTAFVFSAHLLHRGTRNESDRPRPALQVQWRTDGTWF